MIVPDEHKNKSLQMGIAFLAAYSLQLKHIIVHYTIWQKKQTCPLNMDIWRVLPKFWQRTKISQSCFGFMGIVSQLFSNGQSKKEFPTHDPANEPKEIGEEHSDWT